MEDVGKDEMDDGFVCLEKDLIYFYKIRRLTMDHLLVTPPFLREYSHYSGHEKGFYVFAHKIQTHTHIGNASQDVRIQLFRQFLHFLLFVSSTDTTSLLM